MKWPEIPGVEFGFSWDISTNNWLVGRDALKDPLHRTAIKATLTADQIKSLVILDEWWIFEESMDKERLNEWVRRRYSLSENHSYRDTLFCLFYRGFFYESDSSDMGADGKVHCYGGIVRRRRAANIAAAQRTAAMSRSIPTSDDQGCGERCIIGEPPIPACFRACPRLDSTKNTREYPYYLWDIQTISTVRCPPNGANYLVVSHTWGRWRIAGEGATVSGVPWLVPRNTVFDVADLPKILSNVPFKTRYVWFDLYPTGWIRPYGIRDI
ncbi:hypothetical protein F5Y02DRAFT_417541 [Annulohypoxylon stygium]|nr:hypothetical protein F5Y02DRAFT_417541 [Annulohypoxylon stygium]